ncbi:hypothetical protein DFR50_107186 [Roseiarcus fermentans]|uniref:Uncharacterized protein n=1 Tax=Roseiarcus fermentans TaxID=1473586 RepID=A0A366FP58_9HYPH|nr:hypothetical protein [Roseiarcus fermentans]RBP15916.1 hypothetical protein DFR50_107186 [Roseiarcus fermentans]
MRRVLISLLPAAALSLAALPAFAETYTPNGGAYPSGGGVTLPSDTYTPAPASDASPLMILGAPLAVVGYGTTEQPRCGVLRDFNNRYTAVCGP